MKFTHSPGATPVDGFTIRRGIHRGGFGEVYYAVSDAGKEVALKLLQHEQDVELRGVTQCLNLKHPNLVNLFDVKTDSHGESWVVMEYVSGTSLEDVLAAFPNGLPLDEVRDWLTGLVAGVSHLHDRGIVHRDLKPANVYRENGTVKVGDVGLSKKLGSDRRGAHTQSVGTVYYMAPEVAKGQYGPEVDVYSLGIMLYELVTGRVPFTGETTAEILMKHLTVRPDLIPLPEKLRPVVARALEKDPGRRTPTARQLLEQFVQAIDGNLRSASSLPAAPQSGRPWVGGDRPEARNGQPTSFASATLAYAASVPAVPVSTSSPPPVPVRTGNPPTRDTHASMSTGKARPARASTTTVSDRRRWIVLAIALVCGLIMFSPGTPRAWIGLGLMGLAYSAALFARSPQWGPDELEPLAEPLTPLRQALAEPVGVTRKLSRSANSLPLGSLLSREALRETSYSLTLASLCACLLSVGACFAGEFLKRGPMLPTVEMMALFMATTMAGAWALVIASQCARRTSWGDRHPRLVNLIAGVLVGSLAFGLDEFLRVDYQRTGLPQSAFQSLGVHPLTVDRINPTWLGYVVFFGGLFYFRRWCLDVDPQRPKRFSLSRLVTAGLTAFLMTVFFEFPASPAMLWAVTLSATVQLATPWTPTRRRDSFWRS
jgi:eukaryotic-like serine/threonine-protein kinase